jgi:hypothetical protein
VKQKNFLEIPKCGVLDLANCIPPFIPALSGKASTADDYSFCLSRKDCYTFS